MSYTVYYKTGSLVKIWVTRELQLSKLSDERQDTKNIALLDSFKMSHYYLE